MENQDESQKSAEAATQAEEQKRSEQSAREQSEQTLNHAAAKQNDIENKALMLKKEHGDQFDSEGYKNAAQAYLEKHGSLEGMNADLFVGNNIHDNRGKGFGIEEKDGKFIARGTDGTVLEGKDFEEINDKVCDNLKKHCLRDGKEPIISFAGKDPERQKTFSRNAIMKHNITIGEGWPQDQQFWQDLKAEYLKDDKHNLQEWEKMTRKIPDDVMSRTPEERARNKKLKDAEMLKQMRRGVNPHLNPQPNASRQPVQKAQTPGLQAKVLSGRSQSER